jgi:hypothetical protein
VSRAAEVEFQQPTASEMDGAVGPIAPQVEQLMAQRPTSHSKTLQLDERQNGQELGSRRISVTLSILH